MKTKLIVGLILSAFSLSVLADQPKLLEEVKDKMDLPFIEFGKDWLATTKLNKAFQFIGAITGTSNTMMSHDGPYQIRREFTGLSAAIVEDSFITFGEYCKYNKLKLVRFKTDAYCVDSNDDAQARANIITQYGAYNSRDTFYLLQSKGYAKKAYQDLKNIQPGETIKTIYGTGMVLDMKPNNLIQIQFNDGRTRWLRIDEVLDKPKYQY